MTRRPVLGAALASLLGASLVPLGGAHAVAADGGGNGGDAASLRAVAAAPPQATDLTKTMRSKIDAAVERGPSSLRRLDPRTAPARDLAAAQIRCVRMEGERYCLHFGWTHSTRKELVDRAAEAAAQQSARRGERTGEAALSRVLRTHAELPVARQKALETQQLESAAAGLAKIVELRHDLEGQPRPEGFYARHPESRPDPSAAAAASRRTGAYPKDYTILSSKRITEQHRKYWCGPATMQSIAWNWKRHKATQKRWAKRLGTTSSGTSIWQMVEQVNRRTGWDRSRRAGAYITLDISDYSFAKWYSLNKRHYYSYRAPIVLHPQLLKKYYHYLDGDGSGHFQVGRGYWHRPGKARRISYLEPWNPHYFNVNRKNIKRTHRNSARRQYKANLANSFQNIGV